MYTKSQFIFTTFVFLSKFHSSLQLDNGHIASAHFCYEETECGPRSLLWPGVCQTGVRQSPIDLPFRQLSQGFKQLKFTNARYKSNDFWIMDTGYTIQVSLQANLSSSAEMSGYGIAKAYKFAQIHFHWGSQNSTMGSEHTLAGQAFHMEAHLVHYDDKYPNFTAAANSGDPTALAVLAVFIQEGSERMPRNTGFDTIAANIPSFNFTPTHVQASIDLSTFLPLFGQKFYRYTGSLTTPNCNEVVQWTVMKNPISVRPSSLSKFRELQRSGIRHIGNNYRPVQSIGERNVEFWSKI